jgi:transposase-like protein
MAKITREQWLQIERRHLVDGESINSLAQEFGVNESSIRRKIKPKNTELPEGVKSLTDLAKEKVSIELLAKQNAEQIAELPYERRTIVEDLAKKLSKVSNHLLSAAEYGAMTAHRLSGMANMQLDKIDETELHDPESASFQIVKTVAGLTEVANKAAQTGINLLNANKEQIAKANEESIKPAPTDNRTKAAKIAGLIAVAKSRAENAADA